MKLAKQQKTKPTIRFNAELLNSKNVLAIPKKVSAKFTTQGKTLVEGIINSFAFRIAADRDSKGNYLLKLSKSIQNIALRDAQGTIPIEITKIGEEIETRVPADFRKALEGTPKAKALWTDITPLARRDWIFWIISAKKIETRAIRIKKACSKLSSGMRRVCCFAGISWLS